jgi:hypothetical protein
MPWYGWLIIVVLLICSVDYVCCVAAGKSDERVGVK